MVKVPRNLALGSTPLVCLLLLSLFYIFSIGSRGFPSNQWKKMHSSRSRTEEDQHHMHFLMRRLLKGIENQTQLEATGLACHYDSHTEICVSNRPVRIDTLTMKVYVPIDQGTPEDDRTVIPYPKQEDKWITGTAVSPVQILRENITFPPPPCDYTHDVPAVVFSSGGSSGNIFHEFTELIVPLFLTSRHFQSRLQFVVTDYKLQFMIQYKKIFSHLSSYEVINPAANVSVHCFPGAVVGLHYHHHLAIRKTQVPEGHSMLDFKSFLRDAYNLKIRDSSQIEKPTLVLISRKWSRIFLNEDKMVIMMKALGFRVIITQPDMMANMDKFAEIVNSCSVMVGAHGAGLTNSVFLPEGAVLIQVVGLGIDWMSNAYFGIPAKEMGLNYVLYKIEPEESSLITLYGKDHPYIVDPDNVTAQEYKVGRDLYLLKQNFNIDVERFRKTLVDALGVGLLGRSGPVG